MHLQFVQLFCGRARAERATEADAVLMALPLSRALQCGFRTNSGRGGVVFNGVDVMPESETVTDDTVRRVQARRVRLVAASGKLAKGWRVRCGREYT